MLLGTCLKMANAVYFRNPIQLIFVGCAQLVMMLAMFGFMDYMIIVKWLTDWDPVMAQGLEPPGIINVMVAMFLSGGVVPGAVSEVIPGQSDIMQVLLLLIVIAVPLMLFVEPIYEFYALKKKAGAVNSEYEMANLEASGDYDALEPRGTVVGSFQKSDTEIVLAQFEKEDT